jgi:hypothetical protein
MRHETNIFNRERTSLGEAGAREGSGRAPAHYVLIGGMMLAVIALLAMFLVH